MIALMTFAGCDKFHVGDVNNGNDSGNSQGQGEEQGGGGESQSGDSFTYEVASVQPSGAVKEYIKDYWVKREKSAGDFQWMVKTTKLSYDSKGRIAKEEEEVQYYEEGGPLESTNRSTRYRVYDDKAGKMEIRKVQDNPSSAIFKGTLNANGNLTRAEFGGYNGSTWTSSVLEFEYNSDGLLSKVTYPGSSYYPFELSWITPPGITSIKEKDPRATSDPEEDESRNYYYNNVLNPSFGALLDIASFAAFAHVIHLSDYYLPVGKGTKQLVSYANTTYRNEAEIFTYEWNDGKLSRIKLVQKLFPDDAGVQNTRTFNFYPDYYD